MGGFNEEWASESAFKQWKERQDRRLAASGAQRPMTEEEIRRSYISGLATPNIPDAWRKP